MIKIRLIDNLKRFISSSYFLRRAKLLRAKRSSKRRQKLDDLAVHRKAQAEASRNARIHRAGAEMNRPDLRDGFIELALKHEKKAEFHQRAGNRIRRELREERKST
jgi:hypothetical protein